VAAESYFEGATAIERPDLSGHPVPWHRVDLYAHAGEGKGSDAGSTKYLASERVKSGRTLRKNEELSLSTRSGRVRFGG
jgi:hypothetical protein